MKKNIKFNIIKLSLSSPEKIRSWSFGEIKKPETINYRTFKPERDGLFCAKIFGPIKDYECLCGKYKKIKFKGTICEKCGVEVTKSKYRRDRMGHIELSTPVTHIWFVKSLPSKISIILDISLKELEKVIYYESYIVIKSNIEKIKINQVISEKEYNNIIFSKNNLEFEAKMGAEAIQIILKNMNLNKELNLLYSKFNKQKNDCKNKKINKRIKLIESFINSNNKPEWMILNVIPVLPPDLRPLVPLDGGRFATSDLNDLYRRIINRNNRLKKLIDLCAPEIIIRNEKRMLQESVDSLLDNGRQNKSVVTSNKRQLKSLSDMIKGKQGRFRQNLLGKRVDYSGRSVITVGPYLKLNQCGLPKKMALELFKPFVYNKLFENGISNNLKTSKKIVENEYPIIWDILSDIVKDHPILLNRAPTLHRLGIQSFNPILVDGKSIQLHPLVCTAYNADFDGDQMAVHIPLSLESQIESKILMMSTNNILSPANGEPVIIPSQDIIIGIYYMTLELNKNFKNDVIFPNIDYVEKLYNSNYLDLHENIKVRIKEYEFNDNKYIEKNKYIVKTTVGRSILWNSLPKGIDFCFFNKCLNKKLILDIINISYKKLGSDNTIKLIDKIMYMGFLYASKSGISVSIDDFKIPKNKYNLIEKTEVIIEEIQNQYQLGLMTEEDRHNKIIDIWSKISDQISKDTINKMSEIEKNDNNKESYNSVFIMFNSGAKGSTTQIRQISGIRGLMTKPDGSIIENPITANFREGLNVLQYFISTHGARKGLADTALKTANSGYLTRRLVDVAQDLIIKQYDCKSSEGLYIENIIDSNNKVKELFLDKIIGRFLSEDIILNNKIIISKENIINEDIINIIEKYNINKLNIRSVITCNTEYGICSKCYGYDLSKNYLINEGESVGVIAAQSIGEPGTQLTMRTFHIGGAISGFSIDSTIISKNKGILDTNNLITIKNRFSQNIVLSKNSEIFITNELNNTKEKYLIPYGSIMEKNNMDLVNTNDLIAKYDPYFLPIISEHNGLSNFVDIIDKKTANYTIDKLTGINIISIIDYYERKEKYKNLSPKIEIIDSKNNKHIYKLPDKSIIQINNNDFIKSGDIIAKIQQNRGLIRDITGGLPRISDLFEARKPKNTSILCEKSGKIYILNFSKNKNKIVIKCKDTNNIIFESLISKSKQLYVFDGDFVNKGDIISDGNESLHDILRLRGVVKLVDYIINEIQSIYKTQGVKINDKHIEIIIKQMLRKVIIKDPGDSNYKKNDYIEYTIVKNKNLLLKNKIKYKRVLLGITKSSLMTDSFISSASFQETTRVLAESSILGKIDFLKGLKENVIVGRLIPSGTGYYLYKNTKII